MSPISYIGQELDFSNELHQEKYRLPGESFEESANRIAAALKDDDQHFKELRDILRTMRFLPAGRIQAAMGAPKQVTPYNCFVSDTIHDSMAGIMSSVSHASITMRMGGGIGYDFSTLRPAGSLIKGLNSYSGGPLTFMPIYDATCQSISSAGHRRGAQMGIMRIDHPDIEAFILAKQNTHALTGFNLSVAVTDEFMECLIKDRPFTLRFEGQDYKKVDPRALWEMLMRATWDWGEPGVVFIDAINRMNNLYYCETIAATNPCGEQPLPPNGACLLGSFNLTRYLDKNLETDRYEFNTEKFTKDIPVIVRAMDNVIDRALYPLPEQEVEAKTKRRMGLGVTGLANTLEALGLAYGSDEFLRFMELILSTLKELAYQSSAKLAAEKGSFELYDKDKYLAGEFIKTLSPVTQALIRKHGIRNSHLTSIAPTGTISFCADYISSGIEPVFEYENTRLVNMPEGPREVPVSDFGYRKLGVQGKLAANVTAQEHIDVLTVASRNVDSAVSKTCNIDGSMPWEDFKDLYLQAWKAGCKGCTTFNKDGKRMGILLGKTQSESAKTTNNASCVIDLQTGQKDCG